MGETPAAGYGGRLACVSLDPPLHEVFAFISRRDARVSPATRALMALAEEHLTRRSDDRAWVARTKATLDVHD